MDNPNGIFTTNHAFETRYSSNHLYMGRIVNKQRHNDLSMSYDVELFDWGVKLSQCKRSVNNSGFNGNGQYSPLEEGDPVLVLCKNGLMEDAVIVRSFYTTGDYQKYLDKGEGNKPGETVEGNLSPAEANQPSIHPNRVTQPDAYFDLIGSKVLATPFDSPEFRSSIQEKALARPHTGSIIMRNGSELVSYTYGSIINYCDGNNIIVSGGTNEDKCTQLLRLSSTHSRISQLITAAAGLKVGAGVDSVLLPKSFTPSSSVPLSLSDKNESLPAKYRAEQNAQLAKQAMEKAQQCSTEQASTLQAASNMQTNYGDETGSPKPPTNIANEVYIPHKQNSAAVYPGNKGLRSKTELSSENIYRNRYKKAFKEEPRISKPSYSDWISLFEKEVSILGPGSTILLGDSITEAIDPSLLRENIINQGMSGSTTRGILDRVSLVSKARPNKVVISAGINDLLNGKSRDEVYNNLLEASKRIKQSSPNTRVYIQSVLPKGAPDRITSSNQDFNSRVSKIKNEDIVWINNKLREANGEGFTYLDVYSSLVSSSGSLRDNFTTDGIHLTGAAYNRITQLINSL